MSSAALPTADIGGLSPEDFATVARIAQAHAGIVLHPGKRVLVSSRLAKLVRQHDARDMRGFVQLIVHDARARTRAIEALTTNHTKFFRENHHFEHVEQVLRPAVTAAVRARRRVRLWSAGSSSGEEVYSLAMTLLGDEPAAARVLLAGDVALLATDLNSSVIELGRAASYAADAASVIPPALARLWTETEGNTLRIKRDVRELVRFRQLNLLNEWPISGSFDAIFCRNTMIYFDEPTTERLQCRLADQLADGGYLYIGHSERLLGAAADQLRAVGQTIYRKGRA